MADGEEEDEPMARIELSQVRVRGRLLLAAVIPDDGREGARSLRLVDPAVQRQPVARKLNRDGRLAEFSELCGQLQPRLDRRNFGRLRFPGWLWSGLGCDKTRRQNGEHGEQQQVQAHGGASRSRFRRRAYQKGPGTSGRPAT